jgi:ABC-type transport system involved in multi-copper enzyme maturation permease subunit
MYVGALLAAVFSISVFHDYIEDGTELIITSKPITRIKMTFAKFSVVVTLVTIFCLISTIFGPIIYFCFDVS